MPVELKHETFMQRAIDLARQFAQQPFATVIVHRDNGQILAAGWNKSTENPIWHGEIDALSNLADSRKLSVDPANLILYTTAEPCPMCQSAMLWARIGTVVFGSSIETLTRLGWNQIDIPAAEVVRRSAFHQCELIGGVLEQQCDQLYAR